MNEDFKTRDSYRQAIEAELARENDITAKIVLDSENKLITKLLKVFGSGKLTGKTETDLTKIDGDTTKTVEFDGTVTVHAEIIDENEVKKVYACMPVKANSVQVPEDEDLKDILSPEIITSEVESSEIDQSLDVTADLAQFEVRDNKDGYLHIFHPSLDLGTPLGVISYEEYTDLLDKEAYLKDVIEKQATNPEFANHYKLTYAGSFSEPDVQPIEEPKKEATVAKKAAQEVSSEKEEANLFRGHLPDGFEQQQQFNAQKSQADYNRIANTIANDLVNHLRALKYDSVKILSGDFNEDHTNISITASVTDKSGEKVVTLDIAVNDEKYSLPKKDVVSKIVERTTDLKTRISASIAEETKQTLKAIDENESWVEEETQVAFKEPTIEKKAGADSGGVQWVGPVDILHIDKHTVVSMGIPEDLEVGDQVDIDGFKWELSSKDKDALSKEADSGSLWSFRKVTPTSK